MKKNVLILCLISILILSCEKEGPMGPPGKDGIDGNANVISKTITINPSDWIEHGEYGSFDYYYYVTINIPEITNDIFLNGSVIVYAKALNVNKYEFLPIIMAYQYLTTTLTYSYQIGYLQLQLIDSSYETEPLEDVITIKVVIIESTDT